MDIHHPSAAYPTLPSPVSTNLHNPPDFPPSTPTHHKACQTPQPYPTPSSSSPSPLPPTSTTSPPSTPNLIILPCNPSSLPYLLPLLTTTIPLNPFTALMLKPPHNTNLTAHQTLATWLHTAALHDPRAKIIALVAVEDQNEPTRYNNITEEQPPTPKPATGSPPGNNRPQQKKPHARVLGIAWLQNFLPHEESSIRYPLSPHKPTPPIINTKSYARALKLLYTHRETCVGAQGGWYIRHIAAGSEDAICYLLEYAGEVFAGKDREEVVFWQAPPFRAAGGLYERMGWRWGICGGRVVEGAEGAGEGLDWVGWVCRGEEGG